MTAIISKMIKSTAKVVISLVEFVIFFSKTPNDFQLLASLNILKSRIALKASIVEPTFRNFVYVY